MYYYGRTNLVINDFEEWNVLFNELLLRVQVTT